MTQDEFAPEDGFVAEVVRLGLPVPRPQDATAEPELLEVPLVVIYASMEVHGVIHIYFIMK
jgi:hypothetical protein